MGRLQPAQTPADNLIKAAYPCDKCGYSHSDGSVIIHAEYRVDTPKGKLYFCVHHFNRYFGHIFAKGYTVTRLVG